MAQAMDGLYDLLQCGSVYWVEQRGPGKGRSRHGLGYGESLGRDGDKIEGGGASFANAIR